MTEQNTWVTTYTRMKLSHEKVIWYRFGVVLMSYVIGLFWKLQTSIQPIECKTTIAATCVFLSSTTVRGSHRLSVWTLCVWCYVFNPPRDCSSALTEPNDQSTDYDLRSFFSELTLYRPRTNCLWNEVLVTLPTGMLLWN